MAENVTKSFDIYDFHNKIYIKNVKKFKKFKFQVTIKRDKAAATMTSKSQ